MSANDTLNTFADETTLHGVKETYYANRIGRLFWLVVFVTALTLTTIQLRGLVQEFIREDVGTRFIPAPYATEPALNYCNMRWLPNEQSAETLAKNLADDVYVPEENLMSIPIDICKLAGSMVGELEDYPPLCMPYVNYWKTAMTQQMLDDVILPRDKWLYTFSNKPGSFKNRFAEFGIKEKGELMANIVSSVNKGYDGSLMKYVESLVMVQSNIHLGSNRQKIPGNGVAINAGGFAGSQAVKDAASLQSGWGGSLNNADFMRMASSDMDPPWAEELQGRTGSLSINLNGVCWKLPFNSADGSGVTQRDTLQHVVLHLGSYGYQLRAISKQLNASKAKDVLLDGKFDSGESDGAPETTLVSVGNSMEDPLYFPSQIKLNSKYPCATIKFYASEEIKVNRKVSICNDDKTWSSLDQAHCNAGLKVGTGELPCEPYLPATAHCPEARLSNRSCVYDNSGYFEDQIEVSRKNSGSGQLPPLFRAMDSRLNKMNRSMMIELLSENSEECPAPCQKTTFNYDVNYVQDCQLDDCAYALAGQMTPISASFSGLQDTFDILRGSNLEHPPCSVVTYEHTPQGMTYQQYRLRTLSDVASNLGGTLGLWMGASAISVVQLLYLCCLERLFRKPKLNLLRKEDKVAPQRPIV